MQGQWVEKRRKDHEQKTADSNMYILRDTPCPFSGQFPLVQGQTLNLILEVSASKSSRIPSQTCLSGLFITSFHFLLGEKGTSHWVTLALTKMPIEGVNEPQGHALAKD